MLALQAAEGSGLGLETGLRPRQVARHREHTRVRLALPPTDEREARGLLGPMPDRAAAGRVEIGARWGRLPVSDLLLDGLLGHADLVHELGVGTVPFLQGLGELPDALTGLVFLLAKSQ